MPATVNVNKRTVIHASSVGIATGFPDTCLTPAPPSPSPVPIPYPNIAMSSDTADGTEDVKCDGESVCIQGSNFSQSTGDEAGTNNGVVSLKTRGKAEFVSFSFDVKFEGKPVARQLDMMVQNVGPPPNTPPMPEIQPPAIAIVLPGDDEEQNEIESIEIVQ
ncbi:MAG: DUF4150 domain-containing protein [Deltaproteobacteria bacterium]|jgi:hypothetical protein|nr:DUF4150 domain-containing protein [Deltaproteobacteria bacterium]MBW2530527.1 DUF4150 domain-containing protein [Deltaproteobacteria bacterium]